MSDGLKASTNRDNQDHSREINKINFWQPSFICRGNWILHENEKQLQYGRPTKAQGKILVSFEKRNGSRALTKALIFFIVQSSMFN